MDKSILIPSFFRLFVGFNKNLRDSLPPKQKNNSGLVIRLHTVTAHTEEPNRFFIVPGRPINLLLNISRYSHRGRHTQKCIYTQAFQQSQMLQLLVNQILMGLMAGGQGWSILPGSILTLKVTKSGQGTTSSDFLGPRTGGRE